MSVAAVYKQAIPLPLWGTPIPESADFCTLALCYPPRGTEFFNTLATVLKTPSSVAPSHRYAGCGTSLLGRPCRVALTTLCCWVCQGISITHKCAALLTNCLQAQICASRVFRKWVACILFASASTPSVDAAQLGLLLQVMTFRLCLKAHGQVLFLRESTS